MTLTLRAVSLNDQPLTQPITAHFDAKGGTIGRSDHNTMALPDPERHISRQQAEISAAGSGYSIKNVGSANPIVVRGQSLQQGESALLAHRDQVRIGGYLLEVIDESANGGEASTITRGRAAVDASTPARPRSAAALKSSAPPGAAGGLGDLVAPLSSNNPFADLLGSPPAMPKASPAAGAVPASARAPASPADPFADLPVPAGVSQSSSAWAPAPSSGAPPRLPDDFDPFAAPAPPAAQASPPAASGGVFDDLIPSAAPASIDELFGLQPGARDDPLAGFMENAVPLRAESRTPGDAGVMSTDPLALFGGAKEAGAAPPAQAAADRTPELRGAFKPPGLMPARTTPLPEPSGPAAQMLPTGLDWLAAPMPAESRPAPPQVPPPAVPAAAVAATRIEPVRPQPAAPMPQAATAATAIAPAATAPASPDGNVRELWSAFCEGAGVRLDPPQGLNPELMRVMGTLLRTAVEGTLQLVAVRAATKHELRAQVTIIQARSNNPLKFSPDAQSALEQMLQPPVRGFLSGPAAMADAMQDLVGHAIGTMAGTRAALEGVLGRFAPKELEAKLVGKSMLDSLLPMNRKAKLWELYLQHFEAIREEAQEDFHTLFGKAFLAAYEQQLDRLRRDKSTTT